MLRAAIYTRQSKDKDAGTDLEGAAVARQLTPCEKLCADRGWDVIARESDNDLSGYSGTHRPGYQRIIQLMEARRVDVIVVWHVDRLTRRLADLVSIIDLCEKTGAKIATVSGDLDLSTDTGKLLARILGSVAQGEVERKSTRQKLANRQAAEAGRVRKGTPRPFGWLADRITPDPAESAAVADACRALLAGGTVTGVARDWQARGVRPVQSKTGTWTRQSVVTILRNPRIAGIAAYRGEELGAGEWAPLVAEETWRAVVQLLAEPGRKPSQGVRTLLGGLARCRCGNHISASNNRLGQQIYRCNPATRAGREGPHVTVKAAPVDEAIGLLVVNRLGQPDILGRLAPKNRDRAVVLRDEAQVIRARLRSLTPDYVLGKISETDRDRGLEAGQVRLAQISAELEDLGREDALLPLISGEEVWFKEDAIGGKRVIPGDRKRAIVAALMAPVLLPAGRGARVFNPNIVVPNWR